ARPLLLLHQLPVWLVPLVLLALLVTGLAVPGWIGAVALVLVAGFLGWLAAVSWPRLSPSARLLRVAAVAGVLVIAGIQAVREHRNRGRHGAAVAAGPGPRRRRT